MNDWNGSTVLVSTTDDKYSGQLISSDATGLVIALVNSTPASPPFDSLSEDSKIEVYIPMFRIKHVARGEWTGIS